MVNVIQVLHILCQFDILSTYYHFTNETLFVYLQLNVLLRNFYSYELKPFFQSLDSISHGCMNSIAEKDFKAIILYHGISEYKKIDPHLICLDYVIDCRLSELFNVFKVYFM